MQWGSEEFENKLTKAFISLYENDSQPKVINGRFLESCDGKLIKRIRKKGFYVPHPDRVCLSPESGKLDLTNEPLPPYISTLIDPDDISSEYAKDLKAYACIHTARKASLPLSGYTPRVSGEHYLTSIAVFSADRGIITSAEVPVTIDLQGRALPMLRKAHAETVMTKEEYEVNTPAQLFCYIQFWNDRKYLWNVEAMDQKGSILFSCYPEEVKSLFYARDLPLTTTGRKAPILHWVKSHRRRIKSGTDVTNVKKHLRGRAEFEFAGMPFRITQPIKQGDYSEVPDYL